MGLPSCVCVFFSIFHIFGKKIIFENADLNTVIRRNETFCCRTLHIFNFSQQTW